MKLAIVCIPGFRQGDGYASGVARLYRRLCAKHWDRRSSLVLLRAWDSNHDDTAELVSRVYESRSIAIVGHSYGCGSGLLKLAAELRDRGRMVDRAYLIDPVPRFGVLKVRSLLRWGDYSLPANVERCISWRQINRTPFGRYVVGNDQQEIRRYVLGKPELLAEHAQPDEAAARDWAADHKSIDDLEPIHDEIVADLAELEPAA